MARASSWILKESRLMGIEVVGWDICKPPGRVSFDFELPCQVPMSPGFGERTNACFLHCAQDCLR
jgi:hypothetical protein